MTPSRARLYTLLSCSPPLAVFVTALTLRASHRDHEFNVQMHDLTEQVERLAMMALLILAGGALVGGLLAPLQPADILLVFFNIVRLGYRADPFEKLTISFFGIRGVGSLYYLAYGLNHMKVDNMNDCGQSLASRSWYRFYHTASLLRQRSDGLIADKEDIQTPGIPPSENRNFNFQDRIKAVRPGRQQLGPGLCARLAATRRSVSAERPRLSAF